MVVSPPNPENLIWIDLEMTGLNPDSDVILEIATVVTDSQLNVIQEGPNLAVRQPDSVLAAMDEWNTTQHGQSGLIERVRQSRLSLADAERITVNWLQRYVPPCASPMCGNSICQDRRFLWRYMPNLEKYFYYRNLDVSTLKELARRWSPAVAEGVQKSGAHLAMQDIRESILELRHYRQHLLRMPPATFDMDL